MKDCILITPIDADGNATRYTQVTEWRVAAIEAGEEAEDAIVTNDDVPLDQALIQMAQRHRDLADTLEVRLYAQETYATNPMDRTEIVHWMERCVHADSTSEIAAEEAQEVLDILTEAVDALEEHVSLTGMAP